MADIPIIYARSPFIIQVNEAGQQGSKIQVYIGNGSTPTTPTQIASKLIASPTNTANFYNISPYIREYIKHNFQQPNYSTIAPNSPFQYAYVTVKRFRYNGTTYVQLDSTDYYAIDGYGYYEDGFNPMISDILLKDNTTHNYAYSLVNPLSTHSPGMITAAWQPTYTRYIRYTNLVTGAVTTTSGAPTPFLNIPRIFVPYYADGNKLEILDSAYNPIKTFIFKPIIECRYEPVIIDFINRFGAWQREFFFKASYNNISTKGDKYNLLQSTLPNYSITEGQDKEYNNNGKKTIKVNTDFVEENYFDVIQEILLSERILVNFSPVTLKTRDIGKLKKINTKLINYTLEFEYSFDIINSVV